MLDFVDSEEGKELKKRYMKFAIRFRKSISKDENGDIVIDNNDIKPITQNFEDLKDYIQELKTSKWGREAKVFADEIQNSDEFLAFGIAVKSYEWTTNYAKNNRALAELKEELNKNIKVSDKPKTSVIAKNTVKSVSEQWDKILESEVQKLREERGEVTKDDKKSKWGGGGWSLSSMVDLYREVDTLMI